MTLSGSHHQLDKAEIAAFERKVGLTLPESYKMFLLQSNGGRPGDSDIFVVPGWQYKRSVADTFFGIGTGDSSDLEKCIARFSERIPSDCIPIGRDAGGNILCLRIGGIHDGQIYFWDHEAEPEQPESRSNMYKVADTIQALLDSLQAA
jgi:hypothetical protein